MESHFKKNLSITKTSPNFISMLKAGGKINRQLIFEKLPQVKDWPPFIAKVAQIVPNKKSGRFALILSDDENNCTRFKLYLGLQLSPMILNGNIKKNDFIYVKEYAITKMSFGRRIHHAYEIEKIS